MAPNNEHYDTHDYAGDQAADTRRTMNRMGEEDRSSTQDIQNSINTQRSQELAPEVRMGDDRVIGDTPNWDSYSSEQLYNFATQSNSPSTADDLGRAFNDGGNSLAEAANGLLDAVSRLDGAWSGAAADSAKGALAPLAQAAGVAGQTAQLMGVRMSQQSVAATEVRKLPPAKEFDQQQQLNAMLAGGPVAMQQDLKAQKDAADAVKKEQISYLNTYTQAMSSVDAQTPSFVPPQETIGGGSNSSSSFTSSRVAIPGTGTGTPFTGTTTGAPTSKYTGSAGPNGSAPGLFDNNGQTDQSGYTPMPGMGTGASGYTMPNTTTPTPSTFGPGGGPGAGGFGGGFGSFGSPGGAGAGGAASGGPGANAGATPKGLAPSSLSPTGSAAGRGGAGGMGGAPRGKGDKEEDDEHERPAYLVEGDPESTFGSDALTAPPVIGGDD
ncbi:hypothetical protein [Actinophytocola sp.]|uniref:hypothetical protein n=1 Tax=Actinophytocola sp. TaxID=1872138 RepID=UPI002ED0594E